MAEKKHDQVVERLTDRPRPLAPGWEALEEAPVARRAEWIGVLAFETMGRALGRGLATVQNFLDLGAVVFAGSAAVHFDLIEPFVREELRVKSFAPPLAEVPLLVSDLGETAGVIGAAHLTTL